MHLFEYNDYKKYISDQLDTRAEATRGVRQSFATAVGCQSSYLSQVLHGKPNLTLEQAMTANDFFGHTKLESEFFILLVEKGRAGTKKLESFFDECLEKLREEKHNMKRRLQHNTELVSHQQHRYYSTWLYSAIHVILDIEQFQEPQQIARRLNLPLQMVNDVIEFLVQAGLIVKEKKGYQIRHYRLNLGRDSEFIQRHHINWRSQSLQAAEKNMTENLHYSNVMSISVRDFTRIKEVFAKAVEESREIAGPSPGEDVFAFTVDVFRL